MEKDQRQGLPADTRADVFIYIEGFYNRRRIHTSLGSVSPPTYEQLHHQVHLFLN